MARFVAPAAKQKHAGELSRLLAEGVRKHREGRLEQAAACYRRILKIAPQHADALHLAGLVAHQTSDHAGALALVDRALAVAPRQAAYRNSRGVVLLALDRLAEAESAFQQALSLDPLYPEALNNLGNTLQRQHRLDAAVAAYDRAVEGQPSYAEAWCNRGRVLHLLDRLPEAAESLRRALCLRPEWAKALRYLGDVLAAQGNRKEAEDCYRQALGFDAEDGETHAALATLLERSNRLEEALTTAEQAIRRNSADLRSVVTAARAERRLGRPQAALQRLDNADSRNASDDETRAWAAFERGQILDRLQDYVRAYEAFAEGNALLAGAPAARGIDRQIFPQLIRRLQQRFTADWLASWRPGPGNEHPPPVFLIGFPRSGTTLLDQILDAHPALSTMEEKDAVDCIRRTMDRLPGGYPEALADLDAGGLQELRQRYFAEVGKHLGDLGNRTPVDKMPLNTIDAGLIHRLFPTARILLALRHPCDVVLSGFMQAMQPNAAMVLFDSLASTAGFYADVMGLWLHYRQVLPLSVLNVRYEDLVSDFPGETRRILDFLGLPWDDAVLGYAEHAKTRAIATPSYHQVVQPIYRRSVGRWRNYDFAFADVLPLLQPFIDAFGYADAASG